MSKILMEEARLTSDDPALPDRTVYASQFSENRKAFDAAAKGYNCRCTDPQCNSRLAFVRAHQTTIIDQWGESKQITRAAHFRSKDAHDPSCAVHERRRTIEATREIYKSRWRNADQLPRIILPGKPIPRPERASPLSADYGEMVKGEVEPRQKGVAEPTPSFKKISELAELVRSTYYDTAFWRNQRFEIVNRFPYMPNRRLTLNELYFEDTRTLVQQAWKNSNNFPALFNFEEGQGYRHAQSSAKCKEITSHPQMGRDKNGHPCHFIIALRFEDRAVEKEFRELNQQGKFMLVLASEVFGNSGSYQRDHEKNTGMQTFKAISYVTSTDSFVPWTPPDPVPSLQLEVSGRQYDSGYTPPKSVQMRCDL